VTVLLALIFLFVWPGPFRNQYTIRDEGVVRIDRLSGNVSYWTDGQYIKVRNISKDNVEW
jgi:hypothetical protein